MAKVIVWHGGYGCDTGCCAHWVQLGEGDNGQSKSFTMQHPRDGEGDVEFAKRLITEAFGAEHVADLDWDECEIVEDDDCYFWK